MRSAPSLTSRHDKGLSRLAPFGFPAQEEGLWCSTKGACALCLHVVLKCSEEREGPALNGARAVATACAIVAAARAALAAARAALSTALAQPSPSMPAPPCSVAMLKAVAV